MSTENTSDRFEHAQKHSHNYADPKDSLSLADRAKLEKKIEHEEDKAARSGPRPTEIAKSHGNKPSRGAQIDEQIENEEHEELKRKGKI